MRSDPITRHLKLLKKRKKKSKKKSFLNWNRSLFRAVFKVVILGDPGAGEERLGFFKNTNKTCKAGKKIALSFKSFQQNLVVDFRSRAIFSRPDCAKGLGGLRGRPPLLWCFGKEISCRLSCAIGMFARLFVFIPPENMKTCGGPIGITCVLNGKVGSALKGYFFRL